VTDGGYERTTSVQAELITFESAVRRIITEVTAQKRKIARCETLLVELHRLISLGRHPAFPKTSLSGKLLEEKRKAQRAVLTTLSKIEVWTKTAKMTDPLFRAHLLNCYNELRASVGEPRAT
jgi:hypothetical protein